MPLVTSQATFSVHADGSIRITSIGGTDPTLSAAEGKALSEYLADAQKLIPDAQADIHSTVTAAESAASRAVAGANTEIVPPKPRFEVKGLEDGEANKAGTFKVTAVDKDGKPDPDYTGTVHFTSTDTGGSVPGDYSFTKADKGSHEFTGTFAGVGAHSVTATDLGDSSRTGTHDPVYVGTDAGAAKQARKDAAVPVSTAERNPMRIPAEASSTALAEDGDRERQELAHSAANRDLPHQRTDGILPRAATPEVPAAGRPGLEPPAALRTDGAGYLGNSPDRPNPASKSVAKSASKSSSKAKATAKSR